PQESVYPAAGWMKLTLNKSARPLAEQQVNGQRDRIREKLQAARHALPEADRGVAAVQERAKDAAALNPDDQARLNNANEKAREARQELEEAIREAAPVPGLREV